MYNVVYRIANNIVADTIEWLELELGDNQLGIKGIILKPSDTDGEVVYVLSDDRDECERLIKQAGETGKLDLTNMYSIISRCDGWSFKSESIKELSNWAGREFKVLQ